MVRTSRKIVIFISIICFIMTLLIGCKQFKGYGNTWKTNSQNPVKVSVFEYRADDNFIYDISRELEKIQAMNEGKVQFTFYDSKNSQALQNENINKALQEGTDLLLVNLVDVRAGEIVINKIKENNIPVILYNREPVTPTPIQSYSKSLYIGSDANEGGILQGQILVNVWNDKKDIIDINKDGIMQYIMLSGERDNRETIGRTVYSIRIVEGSGIKTQELALRFTQWDEELARKAIESLYFRYGNNIEVIISNDDTMAIGAIKALQSVGYNKDGGIRNIPVVGFDGEEEAVQLIEKGFMTGTVIQSSYAMAEALYIIGMNLVFGRHALEGTPYVFDETGVSIRIPYGGVLFNINTS